MDDQEVYEMVAKFTTETGLDAIQISEDDTECFVGKTIFNTSGSSMTLETLEKRIAEAKVFLAEKGFTDYKAYFGEDRNG
jgi:hypothetical protein